MAFPSYVGAGTAAGGTGDVTPTVPTHSAGDVLVLVVESNADQPAAISGGLGDWIVVPDTPQNAAGSGGTRLTAWYQVSDGSVSNPTITDPGNHAYAVIFAFTDVETSDPLNATDGWLEDNTDTSVASVGVTTDAADCLIVEIVVHGNDSTAANLSGWTNASLANITEQFDAGTDAGGGGGIAMMTGELASAGASGSTTATLGTGATKGGVTIALNAVAGGGTTHFGASSLSATVAVVIAALRTTFGALSVPAVVALGTAARLTAKAATSSTLTVSRTVAGTRTTFGQVSRPETVNVTTNGEVQGDQFGASSVALTATVTTAGTRTTFGAASLSETVARTTVGTRTTFGVVSRTETVTTTTTARLTARAASSLIETVNAVTNGTGGTAATSTATGPPSPTGGAHDGTPTVAAFGAPSPVAG